MKRWVISVILLISLLAAGCGAREAEVVMQTPAQGGAADYDEYTAAPEPGAKAIVASDVPETVERMVVYTGYLDLIVKDTQAAQAEVGALVDRLGGYILSSETYRYDAGLNRVTITLRVPAEAFNTAMGELRALATEVQRDSVSSEDVTQEYVDLASRLRALEVKAEKLEALMDEAEDTEAVLAVYQELSATQQEIEQVKGRMQYLERAAAMSTITVSLIPDELAQPIEVAGWRPQGTAKAALQALINTLQFLVDALIWILIYVAPVFGALGLAIYGFIRLLKLVFRRRKPKTPPAPQG